MPNEDDHETGIVQVLDVERVRVILEACYNNKVIPVMLVLNHTQRKFYGVQHGDIFNAWNALQGPNMRERLNISASTGRIT
uniref:Uncharacterized protein n=1 Tax=Peronospora matthiolae TaxID=2874970 RepID=A0AAV1VLL0_9STRA